MQMIVDANILVTELLRQRGREIFQKTDLDLFITEQVESEARYELQRRVAIIQKHGPLTAVEAERLLNKALMTLDLDLAVIPLKDYAYLEATARRRIPRDPDDWPTVALALHLDAAIWTNDCDFLGCGCPTWTTETLLV